VELSHSSMSLRVRDWGDGRALAWAGIPVSIWRLVLEPGKEDILKGVRSGMEGGADHCVSSGSGSKPGSAGGGEGGEGVDVGVERVMVSVTVVGGADIVMVTVSVRSSERGRMNVGEWEAGEIRRLSTAATNGGSLNGDDNVDGADAGAASVDKISANAKMAIKAMEREGTGSG
jgi:hypothetical protein